MIENESLIKIKSPLRWAGGKTWLIDRIRHIIPEEYNSYYEPFLGGASIFINLINAKQVHLSDLNPELIEFYTQVRDNLDGLVEELNKFENTKDAFYKVRSELSIEPLKKAARFYYLNRTCFNGLFRVNQHGVFNVPYGYRNIEIVDSTAFNDLRRKLKDVQLTCCDFDFLIKKASKGDLVFLDPPYTVAHNNNGFIQYNQKIFSWSDQERLAEAVNELTNRGGKFIMTNAFHESIRILYKGLGSQYEIERNSTISGHQSSRTKVSELIITNIF